VQEQLKKNEEAKTKIEGLKAHFNAGNTLIDQEKQAKIDLAKATPDQRDAAKQKLADLGDQGGQGIPGGVEEPRREGSETRIWCGSRWGEAYETANRFDDAAQSYQQAIAAKGDVPGYYNKPGETRLAKAGKDR